MPTVSQPIVLAADEDGETPLTVAATVVCVERREEPDFLGGSRVGLSAQLHITIPPDTRPHSYFLSRLIGESAWVIDALFGSNGYPHFSHGFGARYLRLRGIAPELEDLLDQNARDQGLVHAIGREVPLLLAEVSADSAGDLGDRA